MSIVSAELAMLGTSTISASCCLAPRARATAIAKTLAVTMVVVMGSVIFPGGSLIPYLGAMVIVVLTGGLIAEAAAPVEHDKAPERVYSELLIACHRAIGAVLMVVALLLHQHMTIGTGVPTSAAKSEPVTAPTVGADTGALQRLSADLDRPTAPTSSVGPLSSSDSSGMTHDDVLLLLLWATVAGYLSWTVRAVWRMRRRPGLRLVRLEHLMMAASLSVMTYGMA